MLVSVFLIPRLKSAAFPPAQPVVNGSIQLIETAYLCGASIRQWWSDRGVKILATITGYAIAITTCLGLAVTVYGLKLWLWICDELWPFVIWFLDKTCQIILCYQEPASQVETKPTEIVPIEPILIDGVPAVDWFRLRVSFLKKPCLLQDEQREIKTNVR